MSVCYIAAGWEGGLAAGWEGVLLQDGRGLAAGWEGVLHDMAVRLRLHFGSINDYFSINPRKLSIFHWTFSNRSETLASFTLYLSLHTLFLKQIYGYLFCVVPMYTNRGHCILYWCSEQSNILDNGQAYSGGYNNYQTVWGIR